jgi:hypothetical protein
LLLGTAAAITAAATSGGAEKPTKPSHQYQDYMGGGQTSDQCSVPVAERSGGWVCPAGGGK